MVSDTTFITATVAVLASVASAAPRPQVNDRLWGNRDLGFEGFRAFMSSGNCQFKELDGSATPVHFTQQQMSDQSSPTDRNIDALMTKCYDICKSKGCVSFAFVNKKNAAGKKTNYCQYGVKYACNSGYYLSCEPDIIGNGYSKN